MKKIIVIVIIAYVAYVVFAMFNAGAKNPNAVQAAQLPTQYVAPTFVPTETPVPSATVGWEATLFIAQATADEARRINAQVTSEFEQRTLDQLQLTSAAEQRQYEILSWTAAAGPTIVPMTMTQQAVINTQAANGQTILAGQLTATNQAPTQMAAMVQMQAAAQYTWIDRAVRLFATFSIGAFALGIGVLCFRWKPPEKIEKEELEPQTETIVQLRRDTGQGTFQQSRAVVPCSPEQLTELAQHVTQGTRTLAINQWEGAGTNFTRPVFHQMRGWLQDNKFAVSTGDGQLAPTNDGLIFLCGWLESQQLPTEYDFAEVEQEKELA